MYGLLIPELIVLGIFIFHLNKICSSKPHESCTINAAHQYMFCLYEVWTNMKCIILTPCTQKGQNYTQFWPF